MRNSECESKKYAQLKTFFTQQSRRINEFSSIDEVSEHSNYLNKARIHYPQKGKINFQFTIRSQTQTLDTIT